MVDKPRISADEMARRRDNVRCAEHENRVAGFEPDPETAWIFEAYIAGEIEIADMRPMIEAVRAGQRFDDLRARIEPLVAGMDVDVDEEIAGEVSL